MSFKIPLAIYIVWHPAYIEGQQTADFLYSVLCRDITKPLIRSMGIPVYFRNVNEIYKQQPLDIQFTESDYTAVIALISDEFVIDRHYGEDTHYREYMDRVFDKCNEDKKKRKVYPIALSKSAYNFSTKFSAINFIRINKNKQICDKYESDGINTQIKNPILHELCRLLMNLKKATEEIDSLETSPPVKLFISHSKHDESKLDAIKFRDYINSQTQLKTFFDANDISYGSNFGEEIKKSVRGESALVVFQSDSYSDREWCRIEVLEAKSAGCPIVIVNAVQNGEKRAFPYLGNYPSIRFKSNFTEIIDLTLEQVLFNLYTKKILDSLTNLYKIHADNTLSNSPELFNFIQLKKAVLPDKKYRLIIYPDPPLGSEEIEILNQLDDNFVFITPLSLPSILKANAEENKISNLSDNSGRYDYIIPEKADVISRMLLLKGKTIGISISESDNLPELGYGISHLKDIMIEIARYILALGGKVAYGGDMRQGGFTELMFDLLAYYKADKELHPQERFFSYLSYPISTTLSIEKEAEMSQNVSFIRVNPPDDLKIANTNEFLKPDSPNNLYVWSRCLTKMRIEMESACNARIFIGGAIKKFKGKCPGILEELLVAIQQKHPVYLVGAFGGITKEAIDALNGKLQDSFLNDFYFGNTEYKNMVSIYNERHIDNSINYEQYFTTLHSIGLKGIAEQNGLSQEDNLRLTITPHISEVVYLILKGLTNRFTK